jgi:trimethylamine--corrinoid protein Co-methyltransferase
LTTTRPQYDHFNQYRPVKINSLTEDQVTLLHEASLEIMSRTGMRFHNQEALDLFKNAGAGISDGNLVNIPHHLIEWALGTVPKNIAIFNQTGDRVMSLGGYRSYFGVGSDCMSIYDLHTGEHRKAVLEDVIHGVRLVDALPELDFVMSMFLPSDVPDEIYERCQMAVMLQESVKPIVFVGLETASTIFALEMAALVAGDMETLQRYPFIINYVNTVSNFQHNEASVQRLLYAAERGIPTIYAPGTSRGVTAPITIAGSMALSNAGHLAGLVLSQLKREGSPFMRSQPTGHTMDMRTMVSLYSAPDAGPYGWDLAHYYGIPTFGAAGCSDAKVFDGQAAAEAALMLFENCLQGANLIHDVGYLDCAMTGSLELVMFCNEVISWLRRFMRNLEISEETLALDLIHEVGPDGNFLETAHTLRHVRGDWQPGLFDRLDFNRWASEGKSTLGDRANQKAKEIITNHRAVPLPGDIIKRLDAIVHDQATRG